MPALDDSDSLTPIASALAPRAWPQHPSPLIDGLRLERLSVKEVGYHDHVFGVDVPYLMVPTGFGEWIPLIYRPG